MLYAIRPTNLSLQAQRRWIEAHLTVAAADLRVAGHPASRQQVLDRLEALSQLAQQIG